jgi:diadenosine tetraphosphatase ApaH/serine/threonine PP2A family protein phosphatase
MRPRLIYRGGSRAAVQLYLQVHIGTCHYFALPQHIRAAQRMDESLVSGFFFCTLLWSFVGEAYSMFPWLVAVVRSPRGFRSLHMVHNIENTVQFCWNNFGSFTDGLPAVTCPFQSACAHTR